MSVDRVLAVVPANDVEVSGRFYGEIAAASKVRGCRR